METSQYFHCSHSLITGSLLTPCLVGGPSSHLPLCSALDTGIVRGGSHSVLIGPCHMLCLLLQLPALPPSPQSLTYPRPTPNSLYTQRWSWTSDRPTRISQVLGLRHVSLYPFVWCWGFIYACNYNVLSSDSTPCFHWSYSFCIYYSIEYSKRR